MRIISGKFRSRPLKTPVGLDVRPSSDRLRETLFNVLAASRNLEGSRWIDLFAGTGAVGIEALSRGAAYVYFVEKARKVARIIEENLNSLGAESQAEVLNSDALAALRQMEGMDPLTSFSSIRPTGRRAPISGSCAFLPAPLYSSRHQS